jgi:hypothetical protein
MKKARRRIPRIEQRHGALARIGFRSGALKKTVRQQDTHIIRSPRGAYAQRALQASNRLRTRARVKGGGKRGIDRGDVPPRIVVRQEPRAAPVEDEERGTPEAGARPGYAPGKVIVGPHPCLFSGSQMASNSARHRSSRSTVIFTASFSGLRRSAVMARSIAVRIGLSRMVDALDDRDPARFVARDEAERRLVVAGRFEELRRDLANTHLSC